MSVIEDIEILLQREGATIIRELQALMVSTGANASGRTSKSLVNDVTSTGTRVTMQVSGGIGWEFVEQGRGRTKRKGRGELRGIIKQWITDKGITPDDGMSKDTLAFLITRAIHQRGTLLHLLQERRAIYTAVLTEDKLSKISEQIYNRIGTVAQDKLVANIKALR